MARLAGFEPAAHGLEVRSSIHLSYRRLAIKDTTSSIFRQDEIRSRKQTLKKTNPKNSPSLALACPVPSRFRACATYLRPPKHGLRVGGSHSRRKQEGIHPVR